MTEVSHLRRRWSVEPGRTILAHVQDWFIGLQMAGHGQQIELLLALLKGLPFSSEVPHGKDLRGVTLSGGVVELDFDGFDFSNARLHINIARSTFHHARFDSAAIEGILSTDCSYASFRGARLRGAFMKGVRARDCCFDDAIIQQVQLENADLQGSSFRGAKLTGVHLVRARLIGCDFTMAQLRECPFQEVELDYSTIFTGATLSRLFDKDLRDNSGRVVARATDWRIARHDDTTRYHE